MLQSPRVSAGHSDSRGVLNSNHAAQLGEAGHRAENTSEKPLQDPGLDLINKVVLSGLDSLGTQGTEPINSVSSLTAL